jgi:hypothetical protein
LLRDEWGISRAQQVIRLQLSTARSLKSFSLSNLIISFRLHWAITHLSALEAPLGRNCQSRSHRISKNSAYLVRSWDDSDYFNHISALGNIEERRMGFVREGVNRGAYE